MATVQTIRWGLVGAGGVCEVKSGPAFYKTAHSELLAVMRRDIVKAEDFAKRHKVPLWYDNADELLANPDIDAIYIATPPDSHKNYAIAAMKAGKHVYIEKPVARNAAECDDIIRAEQQYSAKVCVAHYRRQLPSFNYFAELLNSGAIGKPLLASIDMLKPSPTTTLSRGEENWRVNPTISGGGIFHDLAPHQLDLILTWFGDIETAGGFGYNQRKLTPADDFVQGWARFSSGVLFQGRWHFAVDKAQSRDLCEVVGTEGKITVDFFGDQVIRLQNKDGEKEFRFAIPENIQQPLIEQINAYFRGERSNPSSVSDAKKVMQLIDIFSSH